MRVFVSYAREQKAIADAIAIGIREAGNHVFFDKDSLPSGREYIGKIRAEVNASDLFVFLLSPESVARGAYALSELAAARQKWPAPSGRVLPVEVTPLNKPEDIPPYLASVGILQAEGNLVAETLAAVAALVSARRRRLKAIAGLTAAPLLGATVIMCTIWVLQANVTEPPGIAIRSASCTSLPADDLYRIEASGDVFGPNGQYYLEASLGGSESFHRALALWSGELECKGWSKEKVGGPPKFNFCLHRAGEPSSKTWTGSFRGKFERPDRLYIRLHRTALLANEAPQIATTEVFFKECPESESFLKE
jgi:hypothetical protein